MKSLLEKLNNHSATFAEANQYSVLVGEMLSETFEEVLDVDVLPDGRMYFNIGQKTVAPMMVNNFDLVSAYSQQVMTDLNQHAGIGMTGQVANINQGRIDYMVQRLADEINFDDIKWILDAPVVDFTQSVVDDTIKKNVEFQAKAGLKPKIVRHAESGACPWCRNLEGTYDYPKVPPDVYKRHNRCRCEVDYHPGDGKKQNVHSRLWT